MEFVDNGRGIAPELTDKIFEPLFTTKLRGTGLGLSIIANILRRHGGTIEVVSVPAQGTTFRLRVPLNLAP
jgi:signal transduction histidine kinase